MLDSPERLLKQLVELGVELCKAGAAGVSLLKTGPDRDVIFHWAALAGVFAYPARVFTYFNDVPTPIVEGRILPLYGVDRKPLGTIWVVSHDEGRNFDHGDVEVMQRLADGPPGTAQALAGPERARGPRDDRGARIEVRRLLTAELAAAPPAPPRMGLITPVIAGNSSSTHEAPARAFQAFRYPAAPAAGAVGHGPEMNRRRGALHRPREWQACQ
jgi:hypothetical protein